MIQTTQRLDSPQRAEPTSQVLLDDAFAGHDGRDAALALVDASLNVHRLLNVRSHVHVQRPDPDAALALEQLTDARARLDEVLRKASAQGLRVRLRARIDVELEAPAPAPVR